MRIESRVQRLFIQKLFGEGSHDIDVRFNLEGRVTILHGLNGSGKTITLQLLDAVLKGEFEAILKYPLTKFLLEFEGGDVLELTPHQGDVHWRMRIQEDWTQGCIDFVDWRVIQFPSLKTFPTTVSLEDRLQDMKAHGMEQACKVGSHNPKTRACITSLLNHKFAPMRICWDGKHGYQVFKFSGSRIPLDNLSSGEQITILLSTMLMEVQPGTMVLIDEPERSQHVTWQQTFVDDIMEIAQVAEVDIVLATHSPYIVGQHDDLMVRLGP